jgi:hypothetical protein|tara:strand:+ start:288 stop:494 length:207 start_codon:yes stop_codon:yes gene_type:complete
MNGERIANSEFEQTTHSMQKTVKKSKKVDINLLLNNVRAERKKKKFENIILFGLAVTAIVITGIIASL